MKTRYQVAVALAACLAAGAAVAAPVTQPWYVGASFGGLNTNASASDFKQALVSRGFNVTSVSLDEPNTGWKVFGGFQFLPNLAVEASYADLGKIHSNVKATGVTNVTALVQAAADTHAYSIEGWSVALVGMVHAGPTVLFAKLGGTRWRADIDVNAVNTGISTSRSESGTGMDWGAGLKVPFFNNRIAFRAEWDGFRVSGRWIDFYSAGVEFHF